MRDIIYYAASVGDLRRLRRFLDNQDQEKARWLVSAETNGQTPLVIACRNGHCDVVKYLIVNCKADINQTVSTVSDNGTIVEGATPLWCAASTGLINVVRLLIDLGANVNSPTKDNSTPLLSACYNGHFEIVKVFVEQKADIEFTNQCGHTCLMIASFRGHYTLVQYLLNVGANIERKSCMGNTALHESAEAGNLNILKLLLEHWAPKPMVVNSKGVTPLLLASIKGHQHIVEYLIKLENLVSAKEAEDALLLLGATYVDREENIIDALELWKVAMRYRFNSGQVHYKSVQRDPVPALGYAVEFSSPEDLENLVENEDNIKMQALLIRERILGPAHPTTIFSLQSRGSAYAEVGKLERCVSLWNYALDMQQTVLSPLSKENIDLLEKFTEMFAQWMGEQDELFSTHGCIAPVRHTDILGVLMKGIREVEAGINTVQDMTSEHWKACIYHVFIFCMNLAHMVTKFMPGLSSEEEHEVLKAVYFLLKQNVRGPLGYTALHLACSHGTGLRSYSRVCNFPSKQLAELLLTLGADVNSTDEDGNTPLHIAAYARPLSPSLVTMLLNKGAHLDARNSSGLTSMEMGGHYFRELVDPIKYTKLTCICANIIRKHKIEYKGIVPQTLEKFLEKH